MVHGVVRSAAWDLHQALASQQIRLLGVETVNMLAGGQPGQAEQVAADLRWVDARLRASGPAGPSADLALIGTPRAERMRRVLAQQAHLLAPTDPPHSLTDILCSRVSHDPDWGPQAATLAASRSAPALRNSWRLPDLPSVTLRRTLAFRNLPMSTVVIAPDGTWLATAGGTLVLLWDATQRGIGRKAHARYCRGRAGAPAGGVVESARWPKLGAQVT